MAWLRRVARDTHPIRFTYAKLWALTHYWPAMRAKPGAALRFLLTDPELDNYTYDITNLDELATTLAQLLQVQTTVVERYIRELEDDAELRRELAQRLRTHRDRGPVAWYGRRTGWYCLVRIFKPQVVVEAGVHDGLGSSVLLAALERNQLDGHDGRYIGIDVDSQAGWLTPNRLRQHQQLIVEDSVSALRRMVVDQKVDLFIHDSLHSYSHEINEYRAVWPGLSSGGVLLSDNAHGTRALRAFSEERGRRYAFWREQPRDHFYPGAGIGISLPSEFTPPGGTAPRIPRTPAERDRE